MGGLFRDLTKSVIQNPGAPDVYANPGAETAKAIAQAAARSAAPSASDVDGTIGAASPDQVDVTQEAPGDIVGPRRPDLVSVIPGAPARDQVNVSMIAPTPVVPKLAHPTFGDAALNNPAALTTKGKALSLLLDTAFGAAAGAAASVPTNPHISPGIGPALAAGFTAPLQLRGTIRQQQQQQRAAEIENELRQSQADLANSKAARAQVEYVPGVGVVGIDPDTLQPHVIQPIGQGPDAGDREIALLTAKMQIAKQGGLDPEETRQFVYGISPTKASTESLDRWIADATSPDPAVSGPAQEKLKVYRQVNPKNPPDTSARGDRSYSTNKVASTRCADP